MSEFLENAVFVFRKLEFFFENRSLLFENSRFLLENGCFSKMLRLFF